MTPNSPEKSSKIPGTLLSSTSASGALVEIEVDTDGRRCPRARNARSRRGTKVAAVMALLASFAFFGGCFVQVKPGQQPSNLVGATTASSRLRGTTTAPTPVFAQKTSLEEEVTMGPFLAASVVPFIGSLVARRTSMKAASSSSSGSDSASSGLLVWAYIALWYAFSVGYNIYFKRALMVFPYPWTCALFQMLCGWVIFGSLWVSGLRKTPKLNSKQVMTLLPAAIGNLLLHVGAVVAFFAGAVSFVHIVKASEPVVSCLLNYLFIGEVLAWPVYASLIPIIGGVALASLKELSFTWAAFNCSMLSNLGAAGRAVYSKMVMKSADIGENMDAANTYSVLTVMGALLLLPVVLMVEPPSAIIKGLQAAYAMAGKDFLMNMFGSGLFFYLYNELAFLVLGQIDPVSYAVVNTMKRVAIVGVAIAVFRTPVTTMGAIGSSIAVGGTLLYSLAKSRAKR